MRNAIACVLAAALMGCSGSDDSAPEVAGSWALSFVMYDSTSCTASMALSGSNSNLTGTLTMNSPCANGLGGSVTASASAWNGTQGTFSGQVAGLDSNTRVIYEGTFTDSTIGFRVGTTPTAGGYIGTFTGHR